MVMNDDDLISYFLIYPGTVRNSLKNIRATTETTCRLIGISSSTLRCALQPSCLGYNWILQLIIQVLHHI